MSSMPKWITKNFLEAALRECYNDNTVEIIEFSNEPAIPIGENYSSDLLRTSITYKTDENKNGENISVIIKCSTHNEVVKVLVTKLQLFEKEAAIYTKVFSAFRDILGDVEKLSAKCLYYTDEPNSTIIFEDLSKQGFEMHRRQQGLDLNHCLLVIKKLAYFHAASVILHERDPILVERFQDGIFSEDDFSVQWMTTGFNALTNVSSKWKGYEMYAKKLERISAKVVEKTLSAGMRNIKGFNVLNHGDSWINNFMFSYASDGKPKDLRFVDLQLCKYSSQAIDLQYFWATSPNLDVRNHHFHTIFDKYYTQFVSILKELEYSLSKVPTKEQFMADWNSRAFYGLTAAATVLPIITAPKHKDATLEDFVLKNEAGGFQDQSFNCQQYANHMQYLLPFYDNLGALDD